MAAAVDTWLSGFVSAKAAVATADSGRPESCKDEDGETELAKVGDSGECIAPLKIYTEAQIGAVVSWMTSNYDD